MDSPIKGQEMRIRDSEDYLLTGRGLELKKASVAAAEPAESVIAVEGD